MMLTKITIRNFKRLENVSFDLGKAVVLIGPNNSGKTTALQAITLWHLGLSQWLARRGGKVAPDKRPGVTLNRRELMAIPVPAANLLWRDLHVREIDRTGGRQQTRHVFIDIIVEGITDGMPWNCGLEFYHANDESLYCRPLRTNGSLSKTGRHEVPEAAHHVKVAFLQPMSGLAAIEPKWEPGRINVLIGEGQTAQVLRNLCDQLYDASKPDGGVWSEVVALMNQLFGVHIERPLYVEARGEITMSYKDMNDVRLDLSSAGRGLQQTLMLLAYLYVHPGSLLLLDEPDAHLEVLRQREIYQLLTTVAAKHGSQIIAASHSEIVLREAANRDVVIAFVGSPHRVDDRGSQVLKSLTEIGFDQYYQAEQRGWVLYLEGSTDLAILISFAERLHHPASRMLERPFVHYVGNYSAAIARHFWGLREAKHDLVGIAILDNDPRGLPENLGATSVMWRRREIENYLCTEATLLAYAHDGDSDDLFGRAESDRRVAAMRESIDELANALQKLRKPSPWSNDLKVTDEFLDPLFETYFQKLGLPNEMRKTNYHQLAHYVSLAEIDPEISEVLDIIQATAQLAKGWEP